MGTLDIPLNEIGISQALKSITLIKSLNIDIIYCSFLERAVQTSFLISEQINVPVIKDIRLNEQFLGELEGVIKNQELLEKCNTIESELSVILRIKLFFEELPRDKNILVISHSSIFKIILKRSLISSGTPTIKNAQIIPINILF